MLANNPRPDILDFMSSPFFFPFWMMSYRRAFASNFKNGWSKQVKEIFKHGKIAGKIADSRLIVYSSGERLKPCEVVDPADELLVSILLKKPTQSRMIRNQQM